MDKSYCEANILQLLKNLEARSFGKQYTEYSLKHKLSSCGYALDHIEIHRGIVELPFSKRTIEHLYADVFILLTDIQQFILNTDEKYAHCKILARHKGDENDWEKALNSEIENLTIRYGENRLGIPWTVTFTEVVIKGRRNRLGGERIDWDMLFMKERQLEALNKEYRIPLKYHTGYYLVRRSYYWGLIDNKNNVILDYVYDYIHEKDDGLLSLNYDGHLFTVDINVLPFSFDYADSNVEYGLSIAKKGDLYGVIDKHGNVIIPIQHASIRMAEGYIWVSDTETPKGKYWVYSLEGRKLSFEPVKGCFEDRNSYSGFRSYRNLRYDSVDKYKYSSIIEKNNLYLVQDYHGRWGVLNNRKKEILPCEYDEDDIYILDNACIKARGKFYNKEGEILNVTDEMMVAKNFPACSCDWFYGRKNSKGELITKEKYPQIGQYKNGFFPARDSENKWGLLDKYGDELYPFRFEYISDVFPGGVASVKYEGCFCLVDNEGKPLFPPGYSKVDRNLSSISPEDAEKAFIVLYNGKYGVMGPGYTILVPCIYEYIRGLDYYDQYQLSKKGYLVFCNDESNYKNNLVGLLSINPHQIIIPCVYSSIAIFDNDLLDLSYDETSSKKGHYDGPLLFRCTIGEDKESILNNRGEVLYSTEYGMVKLISRDYIIETNPRSYNDNDEHHCIIYSISLKKVVAKYQEAGYYDGRFLQVSGENGWGLFDIEKGEEVIRCKYYKDVRFKPGSFFPSEGLIAVRIGELYGYIDMDEKWVIEPKYSFAGSFSEGLANVSYNGKCGFVNKDGLIVIPMLYDSAWHFSEGLAVVEKYERFGYIDYSGTLVIDLYYERAGSFEKGIAAVSTDYRSEEISKSGRTIRSKSYDEYDSGGWTSEELSALRGEAMGWESWNDKASDMF